MSSAMAQETVFHSEVHLVNMTFSVRGPDGKTAAGLAVDDFEVFEDGAPQKIRFFAREDQLPLSLGLIVDVSDSQDKFLKRHQHDIEIFLKGILRPSDQAFAVCFGNHLRLVSDTTSSVSQIMDGLKSFDKGDMDFPEIGPKEERELGTALYDAIYFSVEEKLQSDNNRRRALILFTDGEENSSEHDLIDAISVAQDSDVLIFAVRYTQTKHGAMNARNKYGMRVLGHLAAQTGGSDFDGLHTDLPEAFQQISDELRSLYSIAYQSTNKAQDGTFRKVVIQPKQSNLTVRAKAGYYAR
ncbi:VWA domain-containing protein [Alloacidobacterium dinghuense]|uniref:VWA domain-containing protein n=2 Tax=Alloacidobacterium dinghuense TaxID=2763107 RepID=A0A7G8BPV1_9BACT|nr:VWA domain-containing protein [Alloacidobacterium dinghuense]